MEDSIEEEIVIKEQQKTHIYHLPNEVLVFVFNKLLDAKCLCHCYLVSKRFATVIPQIYDVSFTIPKRKITIPVHENENVDNENDERFPKNVLNSFVKNVYTKPIHYLRCIFCPKPPLSASFDHNAFRSAVDFLKKFKDIKSLDVELPSFRKNKFVLKWEAEFRKDSSFCVVLFASALRSRDSGWDHTMEAITLSNELLRTRANSAMRRFIDALWRNHILRHVIEDHHTLEELTITDSKKEGILCLGKKEIAEFHDSVFTFPASGYLKIWHDPRLEMMTSPHILEGATLVMVRLSAEQLGGEDDIMDRIFQGDKICADAAREIYETHKNEAFSFMVELDVP